MDPAVAESLMADLPSTAYYLSRVKPGARQGNAGVYGRWDTKVQVDKGGAKGPELKGEIRLYVDGLGPGVENLSSGLTQVSAQPKNHAHRFALAQAGELADALDRVGYAPLALTIRGALLADDPRAGCEVQKVLADAHSLEEVTDPEARALIADTVARYTPRVKPGIKVRDYQAIGASYARANKYRAIIGDEMGIGKTFQAILALASASDELCPALVVAPASVVGKWGKEIDKFVTGIRYRIVQAGSAKGQSVPVRVAEALRDRAWDVLIVGWSTLQDKQAADLLIEAAQNGRIKTVVYDEIHYAKNPGAARTKAAMKIAHAVKGGRLFLSGTLIENDASEAWAPLNMLNPVEYDSDVEFSDRFGGTGGSSRAFYQTDPATGERVRVKVKVKGRVTDPDKIQLAKLEELRVALRCDMVRRMKADVMPELPPAVRVFEAVEIKPNDRKAYDEAVDLLPGWIVAQTRYQIARKAGERMKIAAQAGRDLSPRDALLEVLSSAQAVSDDPKAKPPEPIRDPYGPQARKAAYELMRMNLLTAYGYFRRFIGEAKAEDVAAVVLDYLQSSTKPTVVFAEHQKVLDYLENTFEKANKRTARIDGTVTGAKRDAIVADFQAGKYDVLVGSQAIKEGVDLTRADDSFFAEQWTNPSRIAQAEARIHRADEFTLAKKASTYHHLYALDTIDEDILALLAAKQAILGAVLGREQVKAGALSVERTGFLGGALARVEGNQQAATEAIPTDAQIRAAEREALRAPKLKIGHIEIDGADYPSVGRFRKSGSKSARGTATDAEDLILSEQVEDVLP
jgi:SNF2 family DNA or RNA helicase